MRKILMAVMRIKDDFVNQPMLMTLYCIGTIICVTVFIVFFGSFNALMDKYEDMSKASREYYVFFKDHYNVSSKDFSFLEKYGIQEIVASDDLEGYAQSELEIYNSKKSFNANCVKIVFKENISAMENSNIIQDISQKMDGKYGDIYISPPYGGSATEDLSSYYRTLINLILIYVICFIGCGYLFKYVFNTSKYENTIYSLVGASKGNVVKIMLIESVILCLSGCAVAIILHLLFKDNILSMIYLEDSTYSFLDYVYIVLFTFLLSIATTIPFFIGYIRNPILKTKREL